MKFSWDKKKRKENIKKHGLDFADAGIVFSGVTITLEDDRNFYGEQRFVTIGMLQSIIVVIVHTEDNNDIRVISMRKATKNEQKLYFKGFSN